MKIPTIISVFLVINCLSVKGQKYFPFPEENANWNVYLESSWAENPTDTTLLRYALHGDTTINDVLYMKLCLEKGDTINPVLEPIGGLRESEKRVFFIGEDFLRSPTDEEVLLYDFNKKVGDTIFHSTYGYPSIVLNIDSILIGDDYRKRYEVKCNGRKHHPDFIVEGIGSIKNGLLGHITKIPTCCYSYWEHVCFSEDGVVKYLNPSFIDCSILRSQTYPIPAIGAEWNNTIIQTDTQGPTQATTRLEAKGDTVINNLTYSKLFATWESSYFQTGECEFYFLGTSYSNRYEGAIRTDDDHKVSYINRNETDPIILYDFSLSVGDSVLLSELKNPYYAYVMQVDTIVVGDTQRKQMTMQGMHGWEDVWIEGIGSLYGLLTTEIRSWEFTDYELTCYRENNLPLYTSQPNCTRCDIATYFKSDHFHEHISVYPNPAKDYILIKSDDFSDIGLVKIYDIAGRVVLTYQASQSAREHRIGIRELREGYYVVRYKQKDNYHVIGFIKQ